MMQTSTPDKSSFTLKNSEDKAASSCLKRREMSQQQDMLDISGASEFSNSFSLEKTRGPTKEEFWDALSSNYDYLMDDGLIATCREASSDLSWEDEEESTSYSWTYTHFIEQFKQLQDLLHHLLTCIQASKKEKHLNKDMIITEEQKKIWQQYRDFNEQGQNLCKRYPQMRDDVNRHLNLLSNKWDAVEHAINLNKQTPHIGSTCSEINMTIKRVQLYLRELENRQMTIDQISTITEDRLLVKAREQQDLQIDIEGKQKHFSVLLKSCEGLDGTVTFGQHSLITWNAERVRQLASNLTKRWHKIWLKSLETQSEIELQLNKIKSTSLDYKLDKSYSEEPAKKYPRLCSDEEFHTSLRNGIFESEMNSQSEDAANCPNNIWLQKFKNISVENKTLLMNDKGIMVGTTGISELKAECSGGIGKFEIVQDVGYSSETSAHLSNDEHMELSTNHGTLKPATVLDQIHVQSPSSLPKEVHLSHCLTLSPDKYPSINLERYFILANNKQLCDVKYKKTVPDTFYKMTSLDSNMSDNVANSVLLKEFPAKVYAVPKSDNNASDKKKSAPSLENNAIGQIFCPQESIKIEHCNLSKSDQAHGQPQGVDQSEKVQEWLNNCHEGFISDGGAVLREKVKWPKGSTIDSSCDASGECTTTESDGEKSATSDVNNSVTFSQSFSGSVETVIPLSREDRLAHSDRAGSSEPSPTVRMRKKKHCRDRPWSVSEIQQGTIQSARFTHSISEGALNALPHFSESRRNVPCFKKMRLGLRNSSLTDVSVLSCPLMKAKSPKRQKSSGSSHSDSSDSQHSTKKAPCKHSDSLHDTTLVVEKPKCSSSDHHSASSSRSRGQGRHKRRIKSSHSESSLKNRSHNKENFDERHVSNHRVTKKTFNADDQSSASDQVWDEYQDPPYLSEPYSEPTADEEQVRKLINFGDDYCTMLGSHSDASSIIAKIPVRKPAKSCIRPSSVVLKNGVKDLQNSGSDSDTDYFQNALKTSIEALQFVAGCLDENTSLEDFVLSPEFDELIATCQTNLCYLHEIHAEIVSRSTDMHSYSPGHTKKLKGLIQEWEVVQAKLTSMVKVQKASKLSAEDIELSILEVRDKITAYKNELSNFENSANSAYAAISSTEHLESNIKTLQAALATLQEMKGAVLSVSARVVRLNDECGSKVVHVLREEAAKLYHQWEDVYELTSSQLTQLQTLHRCWIKYGGSDLAASLETLIQEHGKDFLEFSLQNKELSDEACLAASLDQLDLMHKKLANGFMTSNNSPKRKNRSSDDLSDLLPACEADFRFGLDKEKADIDSKAPAPSVNTRSIFWRAVRAALPIQLALVLTYCLSCLMEPQCCESMNTFYFSLFPQLRHVQGPPPV